MTKIPMSPTWLGLIIGTFVGWNVNAQMSIGVVPHVDSSSANRVMTVPFVTVRAIEQNKKGLRYYGTERGEASVGDCTVALDARKNQQIIGLQQHTLDEVLDRFSGLDGQVAIYIHGYNVAFEQSCREAALLQERVGLEGRLLLFSWPADGNAASYLRDVGDIEWSVVPLRDLLLTLADRFGSQNIDLIGHSLGAKGVVDAVSAYGEVRGRDSMLGRLILIAPDLDSDIFVRDFATFGELASAVTVYVSAQDRALRTSRNVSNAPRVGEGGVELSELDGIDVVEVSQRRWKFSSGHLYHLEDENVAEDLREVLSGPPLTSGWRTISSERN